MNRKKIALGIVLAGTLLITGLSGQALACWGCSAPRQAAATPVEQAKVHEIRQKYDADLSSLEAKLRTTSRDLDEALSAQDSVHADEFRQKLYDLERKYYTVRDQAWSEMAEAGVAGNWAHAGWNCRWHEGHEWASRGEPMAGRWRGHRGSCCW